MPKYLEYIKAHRDMKTEHKSIQGPTIVIGSDRADSQRKSGYFKSLDKKIECERFYLQLGLQRMSKELTIPNEDIKSKGKDLDCQPKMLILFDDNILNLEITDKIFEDLIFYSNMNRMFLDEYYFMRDITKRLYKENKTLSLKEISKSLEKEIEIFNNARESIENKKRYLDLKKGFDSLNKVFGSLYKGFDSLNKECENLEKELKELCRKLPEDNEFLADLEIYLSKKSIIKYSI